MEHSLAIWEQQSKAEAAKYKDSNTAERGELRCVDDAFSKLASQHESVPAKEALCECFQAFHAGSAEDNPGQIDESEGCQPAEKCGQFQPRFMPEPVHGQGRPVQRAPEHKSPRRPMPEAPKQEGDPQIAQGPPCTASVPAKRNIEVIPQPAGKSDVPASPEFLYAGGLVGRIEVLRQMNVEKERAADGHVAVGRKIEIELQCIADAAERGFEKGERGACVETLPDDR